MSKCLTFGESIYESRRGEGISMTFNFLSQRAGVETFRIDFPINSFSHRQIEFVINIVGWPCSQWQRLLTNLEQTKTDSCSLASRSGPGRHKKSFRFGDFIKEKTVAKRKRVTVGYLGYLFNFLNDKHFFCPSHELGTVDAKIFLLWDSTHYNPFASSNITFGPELERKEIEQVRWEKKFSYMMSFMRICFCCSFS